MNPIEEIFNHVLITVAVLYVAYAILDNAVPYDIAKTIGSIVYWIGIFFAPFSLIDCFVKILNVAFFEGGIWEFGDKGLYLNFTMMAVGGAIFLTIVLMKDYLVFMWIRYKFFNRTRESAPSNTHMDSDVLSEVQRVQHKSSAEIMDSNLVLSGLSKFYGNNQAVKNMHVGVEKAECFGLLGVNGSGLLKIIEIELKFIFFYCHRKNECL
jgi:hypothetical protein